MLVFGEYKVVQSELGKQMVSELVEQRDTFEFTHNEVVESLRSELAELRMV